MEMREGESQGKSALAGAGHAPRRRGQLGAFEHFQSATPQGDKEAQETRINRTELKMKKGELNMKMRTLTLVCL